MFQLYENRASVHTLEFIVGITGKGYKKMKNRIYEMIGQEKIRAYMKNKAFYAYFPNSVHIKTYCCHGVTLYLSCNPRILVENDHNYIGIFDCNEESIKQLYEHMNEFLKEIDCPVENLNDFKLSRVDLCLNIHCQQYKMAQLLIRGAIHSPITDSRYHLYQYEQSKKNQGEIDKHYFAIESKHLRFTIYDKLFEREERFQQRDLLTGGLIRIELALMDSYTIEQFTTSDCVNDQERLLQLAKKSGLIIWQHCKKLLGEGMHLQQCEAEKQIEENAKSKKEEKCLKEMIHTFCRSKNGFNGCNILRYNWSFQEEEDFIKYMRKKRKRLQQMNLHPVPLQVRTYKQLPNITMVLENLLIKIDCAEGINRNIISFK